jgi:K+-sensing histidine kinase KdpD
MEKLIVAIVTGIVNNLIASFICFFLYSNLLVASNPSIFPVLNFTQILTIVVIFQVAFPSQNSSN